MQSWWGVICFLQKKHPTHLQKTVQYWRCHTRLVCYGPNKQHSFHLMPLRAWWRLQPRRIPQSGESKLWLNLLENLEQIAKFNSLIQLSFMWQEGLILLKYLFTGFTLLYMYCDVWSNLCIWQTVAKAMVPWNLEVVGYYSQGDVAIRVLHLLDIY